MIKYPKLIAHKENIKFNAQALIKSCQKYGVEPVAVTKLVCSAPSIIQEIIQSGIDTIADSRIKNLKKAQHIAVKKMLLRLPALSEVDEVIKYSDISLNSELDILQALSRSAVEQNKIHQVIIMHDLGDLREGSININMTQELASTCIHLENIELLGIGSNLACFGGVEPSIENQSELVAIAKEIENKYQVKLKIISGASSAGLPLMMEGNLPTEVNQLRLGASILMGIGLNDMPVKGTKQNTFTLSAEIIEVKRKPSVPQNSSALDAFGNVPTFTDRGNRMRAICAIGKQDVNFDELFPEDADVIIVGGSSDHLILDVDDCQNKYKAGDIINFNLGYSGVLQCMTSEYISKDF